MPLPPADTARGRQTAAMMARLLLAVCVVWVGGVAGLYWGGAVVPADSGLAGPGIVAGYGVLGAAIGLLAGGLAAWKLSQPAVRSASRAMLAVSLLALAALAVTAVRNERERGARSADEEAARQAPFRISAVVHRPDHGATFVRIDIDGTRDTFEMTDRRKPGHPACRGTVGAEHRARILDALRRAEDLIARGDATCADAGEPDLTLRWSLPERGGAEREVRLTPACSTAHPELAAVYVPIEGLAFAADSAPGGLVCDVVEEPTSR